ncbi:SURF1 family protein [Xanthobacter sp. KR7-225]|uniref:SURF1 family protein n=1 Tax=Xanthobacter sp. KR7-225 TaxID=3156613 RepID=UPI0032B54E09
MRRSPLLASLLALAAFAVLVGLGTWQLDRRAWKRDLLATITQRAAATAAPLPAAADWPRLDRARDEYRHVAMRGTYDHAREALVYGVAGEDLGALKGAPGYFVFTPLIRPDGPPVLVNRGFVPLARRDAASRAEGQVTGPQAVTGTLRFPEETSVFVPANDPARDAFYRRDPVAIAAARGLSGAPPFYVELDRGAAPGGLPASPGAKVDLPNRHLEYALTWYGLAATLAAVVAAVAWSRRRGGRAPKG